MLISCRTNSGTKLTDAGDNPEFAGADEGLDVELGEQYEKGSAAAEKAIIDQLVAEIVDVQNHRYSAPPVPRDVHTKSHGCLQGTFTVDNHLLPQPLRVGVFEKNADYKTWIRFSNNGSKRDGVDNNPDIRGLGIKVMGVPGVKVLASESDAKTQDFLFLGEQAFFIKDNEFYIPFFKALSNGTAPLFLGLRDWGAFKTSISDSFRNLRNYFNPLDIPFYSAVAMRLGSRDNPDRKAVRYSFTRTLCPNEREFFKPQIDFKDPNYLHEALKQSMVHGSACFDLAVQIRPTELKDAYPVENSTIDWPTELKPGQQGAWAAPYLKVGSFVFAGPQEFDSRNDYCENLRFTPWHSLPAHRPLGRINRARRAIYQDLAKYRQDRNKIAARAEPSDFEVP